MEQYHLSSAFAALGLQAEFVRAVSDQGYTEPTPVQAQTIPLILAGRDVLAGAQTGTGKTASFTLPVLQRLLARRGKPSPLSVRALIVTPTRELAAQVEESVRTYGRHVPLRSTTIFGGVSMHAQVQALRRGVDLLVATPGRLLDHVHERTIDLSKVEILILDEADRMLDMGFIRDIRKILALLPKQRQSLLFSATFSNDIRDLAASLLIDPAQVQIAPKQSTADLITQRIHPVVKERKRELLVKLIAEGDWQQVLVFAKTKHGANRLAEQIERERISAAAIHGDKSQPQRTKALAAFKSGAVRVLVATDIAARGIDIVELPHVVNYDLPNVPEDYVHRIGRTGRAGSSGEAVSLVCAEDRPLLVDIEKLLGRRIPQDIVPGFEAGANLVATDTPKPQGQRQQKPPSQQAQRRDATAERHPRRGGAPAPQRGVVQRDGQHQRGAQPQRQNGQPQRQANGQPQRQGNGQPQRQANGQAPARRSGAGGGGGGRTDRSRQGNDGRQRPAADAPRRHDDRHAHARADDRVTGESRSPSTSSAQPAAAEAPRKTSRFAQLAALFRSSANN